MRILHLIATADLAEGGPIEGAVQMGAALAARGHSQDLVTLDSPDAPFIAAVPGRVIALGDAAYRARGPFAAIKRKLKLAPGAVARVRSMRGDYDIAIVAGLWNYSTVVARRALVGGPLPYTLFTHGMLDPWFKTTYPVKSAIKQLLWLVDEGVVVRRAARVLYTCEEERLLARTTYRPFRAREEVVGFGTADIAGDPRAQIAAFRRALPSLGEQRFLLFLSRIHEKKGVDLLIEAFAKVADQSPDMDLVIAGPDQQGLRAALAARAEILGIAGRIHWSGMIAGDVKWGAFRACEAFVLPSHQENFGVVIAEAMACGRPVLTTNKVNIWREIEADGAGIITRDDVDGVTAGLQRFLALDADGRALLGSNARASFLDRYQIDRFIDRLEAVLRSVVGETGRRSTAVGAIQAHPGPTPLPLGAEQAR